jgi:hypothetical protein
MTNTPALEGPTQLGRIEETSIASSVIPYPWDDNRALYLSYRACGFSVREALNATGVKKMALSRWKQQPVFKSLELKLPELRKQVAKEYILIETLRNYRLVLRKDYEIVRASLDNRHKMSEDDHKYLLKMRSIYTPQQLEMLEAIALAGDFDFSKIVAESRAEVKLSHTKSVTMSRS